MAKLKYRLVTVPVVGRVGLFLFRATIGLRYFYHPLAQLFLWLFRSREVTNITYNLTGDNVRYLASFISYVMDEEYSTVLGYINEIENNEQLKRQITQSVASGHSAIVADSQVRFGRRVGWYAIARICKPRVIVETGVDKGLGACVLTAALIMNEKEGAPGRYYGLDINPDAGYLLTGANRAFGDIIVGDSIRTLRDFPSKVDLFINDSDHSPVHEAQEYDIVAEKLTDKAVILGDNCHATSELLDFSLRVGRNFVYFSEKPESHWYPGGGIGISFR